MKMKLKLIVAIIFIISIKSPAQIITTYAGTGIAGYNGDSILAINAQLNYVGGIIFDDYDNLFICDANNERVRKVDAAGIITTFAGNGTGGYAGDNGLAINAQISGAHDVVFDAEGNLLIADFQNSRIRKVDTSGVITTVAGNGLSGASGDSGLAVLASIGHPDGIVFDAAGNLYIAQGNDHCLRKIDTAGVITTIAGITGNAGYNGDGIPAVTALLSFPVDVAVDSADNIFIAEYGGARIRKIDNSGIITTVAGTGSPGYNGDSIPAVTAMISSPTGIDFSPQGNLFITDGNNNRVRKIDSAGIITTVAGIGTAGFSGDNGLATLAELNYPFRLAFNSSGNLFIADDFNNRVRMIEYVNTSAPEISYNTNSIIVFPNPFSDKINITAATNEPVEVTLFDVTARKLLQQTFTNAVTLKTSHLAKGMYLYVVRNKNGPDSYREIKKGKIVKD